IVSLKAAERRVLEESLLERKSVLASYGETNFKNERLEEVKEFFKNHFLQNINSKSNFSEFVANGNNSNLMGELLNRADLQVRGYEEGGDALYFSHETTQGRFSLPVKEESVGTQRYFGLTGVVAKLVESGHSVAIDELETSLHPDLVSYLIEVFLINSSKSQILATTHAQYLLESDYIRRDMVWFCEKESGGGSEYYSAQDFGLHKNINLRNFYRAGKLGGVPILGSPLMKGNK
ncbi:MAG: ATP-binding protein, partial [Spirochaetales bacterium]|nr:ATP-binding protein [Spirochaetales bacterium]